MLAPFAKEGGTFDDSWDDADEDPTRCMRRAGEWVAYCGSDHAVTARFVDGTRTVATQSTDERCEITLPPEGCPAHHEVAGTFNDAWDGSDRDPTRCLRRAAEYHDYCANTQVVHAAFYQAGRLISTTKSAH